VFNLKGERRGQCSSLGDNFIPRVSFTYRFKLMLLKLASINSYLGVKADPGIQSSPLGSTFCGKNWPEQFNCFSLQELLARDQSLARRRSSLDGAREKQARILVDRATRANVMITILGNFRQFYENLFLHKSPIIC
jgi:hypothetical protein